ncbi:MAG: hypothetical protein MMC23_009038 [Stictis urceolatum]|nr:hypothetical protein [Stictis urceolata]
MASATQRAIIATKVGSPLTLTTTHPIPQPDENQVQIKVSVAGLNPHDMKARDTGLFIAQSLPAVLTNDVVGTVTSLGPSVTKYAIGDLIVSHPAFTLDYKQTGLQEYAVADVDFSAKIPEGVSSDEAATLPTNIIAPLFALFDTLEIPAPWTAEGKSFDYSAQSLLIIGGGSNCGRFAVQLAGIAGIGKIAVVGGSETELKAFGATYVLDRHGGDDAVSKRIRDVFGDELTTVFDTVNPPDRQPLGLNVMSSQKKGVMARLLPIGPVDHSKVTKTGGYEVRDVFGSSQVKPGLAKPFWELVPGWLTDGKLKPLGFKVEEGLDADKVNAVLDAYKAGKPVTKTHFHF